jgi:hypothetical protein
MLTQPLAEPILGQARQLAASSGTFDVDALDARGLAQSQRGARFLAAVCAGYARDATPQQALNAAFFVSETGAETALGQALNAAPQLLAHCAAVALSSATFDRNAPPQQIRSFASKRAPHLLEAASVLSQCQSRLDQSQTRCVGPRPTRWWTFWFRPQLRLDMRTAASTL